MQVISDENLPCIWKHWVLEFNKVKFMWTHSNDYIFTCSFGIGLIGSPCNKQLST